MRIETITRYSALIRPVNDERTLVDMTARAQAVEQLRIFIDQRMEYLETTERLR